MAPPVSILVGNNTVADNSGIINGWNNIGLYISGENTTISNSGTISGKLTGIEADSFDANGLGQNRQ